MSRVRTDTPHRMRVDASHWPFAERHPRSAQFEWADRPGPFRRLTHEQIVTFDRLGYLVLEGALDRLVIAEILEEIEPWAAIQTGGYGAAKLNFTCNRVAATASLRRLCRSSLIQDLCYDLVGGDVRLYWDQAAYKDAGSSSAFPWHQDGGYGYVEPQFVTCWIALTDATLDNGCLVVFPGVHRQGLFQHQNTELGLTCAQVPEHARVDVEGAVALPVRAGSVVILSSLTPHATGPNHTREVRKAYVLQFAAEGIQPPAESVERASQMRPDEPPQQLSILSNGIGVED